MIEGDWSYGTSYASWSWNAPTNPNPYYTVWAEPALIEYYSVEVYSTICYCYEYEYEDVYGYESSGGGIDSPSIWEYPGGYFEYDYTNVIPLDYAYSVIQSSGGGPPYISSISPGSAYQGDTVYLTLYGSGFDYSIYVSEYPYISQSSISYATWNQMGVNISIASGTPPGIYYLVAQSARGQSNSVAFQVLQRPTVTIQIQSGFVSAAGNGLVVMGGPYTAITALGSPAGGSVTWTAGPNLQVNGIYSANASVTGTAPSTSGGDTYISVQYTVNGRTASASVRFTVLDPRTLRSSDLGGPNDTVPYNNGSSSGYYTTLSYYVWDQMNPSNPINLPGIAATETLSTLSNPYGASFAPPDGTPKTTTTDLNGQVMDQLSALGSPSLPAGFSASRSQSWMVNNYGFTPNQIQNYTQSYATIQTQILNRQ